MATDSSSSSGLTPSSPAQRRSSPWGKVRRGVGSHGCSSPSSCQSSPFHAVLATSAAASDGALNGAEMEETSLKSATNSVMLLSRATSAFNATSHKARFERLNAERLERIARKEEEAAAAQESFGSASVGDGEQRATRVQAYKPPKSQTVGEPRWFQRIAVHPYRPWRVGWDLVQIALLVYVAVIVPMRVTMDIVDYCPSGIWIFESCIDVFFMVDLLLNFFTAVVPRENELVFSDTESFIPIAIADARYVAIAYLRSWFLVDFLSAIPFEFALVRSVWCLSGVCVHSRAQGSYRGVCY